MPNVDTAELRRLLAEATPGPWKVTGANKNIIDMAGSDPKDYRTVVGQAWSPNQGGRNDAALIAAAVNALPALLDLQDENAALLARAEAAEAKVAEAREAIETAHAVSIDLLDFIDEHASVYFACVLEDNYGNRLRALAGKEGEE